MSIKENIERLRDEITDECARAGRNVSEITVVAASKYADAGGIREAYDAGLRDFGENRVQEALAKMESLPADINWHFIGHLQRNKATKVVGEFDIIHSVDSLRLAEKINQVARDRELIQRVMLEINISGEESKFGLDSRNAEELAAGVSAMPNIELTGLMTIAPFTTDETVIRAVFRGLRELRDKLSGKLGKPLPNLSMGMTNDWRIAIAEGATHLRIGSAIFIGE
ncbi:YggS family pyridoxal phosphate-dependent enzyme [bacterium]|nr:MAG: YggS family pyridoxal phosphate-dependent enzyme [bacterium]